MNFAELLGNINWLSVITVTVLSFVLGMLWHQPFLFGKVWGQEINPSGSPMKINAPLTFGGTAVFHLIAFAGLSAVVSGHGAIYGLLIGLAISILWVVPSMGGTYPFASRRLRLFAIDAGFYTVLFSAAGLIFGAW